MADEDKDIPINHEASSPPQEAASEAAEPELSETEQLEALLNQRDEEIKQLKDRILRLAAEMENTRKRLEREKSDGICYANESLMREFLPVIDNLERALEHGEAKSNTQSLLEGIRMTLKGFLDAFGKFGCAPFDSVGKSFDPNFHEAVMQQETPDHPEMTVLQELQKGYTLRDRLLRPAMVVVSKPAPDAPRQESTGDSET